MSQRKYLCSSCTFSSLSHADLQKRLESFTQGGRPSPGLQKPLLVSIPGILHPVPVPLCSLILTSLPLSRSKGCSGVIKIGVPPQKTPAHSIALAHDCVAAAHLCPARWVAPGSVHWWQQWTCLYSFKGDESALMFEKGIEQAHLISRMASLV